MSLTMLAHSGLRYLVYLAGLATVLYALHGLVTRRPWDRTMRLLASLFAGSLYLQIFAGVALLFSGRFQTGVGGHVLVMVFAAAVAQIVPSVMRRRPLEERSYGPYAVAAAVSLGLVVAGVAALGGSPLG